MQETQQEQELAFKLATVTIASGSNFKIKFDGEAVESQKIYKRLGSYSPTKGDRVLLASVSGTYVVLGKVI
ncbi:hypothetical protein [uncultured Clostridium sp.]|uniref:hypothetical protein n=1 Tax=uncultured Clostridium sp. TaxID=59620 RepID=UPI0028E3736C|nr:hypothetical protein [uncultured Clostridium sp.]